MNDVEQLRARFRPERVRVLFVGESPPAGGTFFYAENSHAYREMRALLEPHLRNSPNFLTAFQEAGFFVDDLVLTPVNHHNDLERERIRTENIRSLAERLRVYRPDAVVAIMKGIAPHVRKAYHLAELKCPFHAVSFPSNRRQADFRRQMTELLPQLGIAAPRR